MFISHRGYWRCKAEQNSRDAFERSFAEGFGVETDLRDFGGDVVIAHDIQYTNPMTFAQFLELYRKYNCDLPLALNVKADGLQERAKYYLERSGVTKFFFFDMSVPDLLGYQSMDLTFYSRQSEYEPQPAAYEAARGVWLDQFHSEWITSETLAAHVSAGKEIAIVSPELHRRPHLPFWQNLRDICSALPDQATVALCTDFPGEASEFFY
jgi:glycerophosphoryl diester phosphodiesterase